MHAISNRRAPWLGLAVLLLASGCPASPADVTLREVDGAPGQPDARAVADAGTPDASDPGVPDAAVDTPDARPSPPDAREPDAGTPLIRHFGQYDDLLGTDEPPVDTLILQAATVTVGGSLDHIGIIIRGASGTSARLVVYRDSAGRPDTLVAITSIFTTQPGRNERPPSDPAILEPGTYWIGMHFADTTGVSQGTVPTETHIADIDFTVTPPLQLSGTQNPNVPLFNLYIGIQE